MSPQLAAHLQTAANRDLRDLADDCLAHHHRNRYRLSAGINMNIMACGNLIDSRCPGFKPADGVGAPTSGIFAGLNVWQILDLCFDDDAQTALLQSAGNYYQFWSNVGDLWHPRGDNPLTFPMPLTELQRRLDRIIPFGFSSTASDWKRAQLMPKLTEGFDPNKLDAAYAAELLEEGVLLLYVPSDYKGASQLVISPLFRKLVPGYQLSPEIAQYSEKC